MVSARTQLVDMVDEPDMYAAAPEDLLPVQLAAAREYLEEFRDRVDLLAHRARETGTGTITSIEDIVPVLFSHTAYKSYPQTFVSKGQWDRLLLWYQTVAAADVTDTELSGVTDLDDFLARLWDAGHYAYATSGTSGKCSLLNHTAGDNRTFQRIVARMIGWPRPLRTRNEMRMYFFGPKEGPLRAVHAAGQLQAEILARPGEAIYLSDEPLRMTDIAQMAELRLRMSNGTATPAEIARFEAVGTTRTTRLTERLHGFAADLLAHRHEPLHLTGQWAQHWTVVQAAREMGIADGEFHPDTMMVGGGGNKGMLLPPDYREQIWAFYGPVRRVQAYGMSEMMYGCQLCEARVYHCPPWVLVMVLDQLGERLAPLVDGVATGRFAFLDTSFEGRWGGTITGDRVEIDYRPLCACGHPGPVVLDTIGRYSELEGGDDKIGCAGTIDAYLRGVVGA